MGPDFPLEVAEVATRISPLQPLSFYLNTKSRFGQRVTKVKLLKTEKSVVKKIDFNQFYIIFLATKSVLSTNY